MNHLSDKSRLYITKFIPLLWNRLRITHCNYKLFIRYNVIVETKKLSVISISQKRLDRLNCMLRLSNKGYSSKQISEYLNRRNLKTPNGSDYNPKLVWGTLFKFRRRYERMSTEEIIKSQETLIAVPAYCKKLLF